MFIFHSFAPDITLYSALSGLGFRDVTVGDGRCPSLAYTALSGLGFRGVSEDDGRCPSLAYVALSGL